MRIGVFGSSHSGALRRALPRIEAAFPDVAITMFGVPGAAFHRCKVTPQGHFAFRPSSKWERGVAEAVNGATGVALEGLEKILLIGYRFNIGPVLSLLRAHGILGVAEEDRDRFVSPLFLEKAIAALVGEFTADAAARLGADPRFVLTPAPAPAETILKSRTPDDQAAIAFARHPLAQGIWDHFRETVAAAVTGHGYGYLDQPARTFAGPNLTKSRFTFDARDFRDEARVLEDHRHMNAEYGYAVFARFAQDVLGLHPNEESR